MGCATMFSQREMTKSVKRPSRKGVIATMRQLCRNSVRPETDVKYGNAIKRMRTFLSERGLRKMGVREFEEFIADLVAKKRAGSITGQPGCSGWRLGGRSPRRTERCAG